MTMLSAKKLVTCAGVPMARRPEIRFCGLEMSVATAAVVLWLALAFH